MSKNLDVQGILTEVRSDIECIVMAARQLPPEEGGPIGALADAAGKKIEKALRQLGAEVAASHGATEGQEWCASAFAISPGSFARCAGSWRLREG